MAPAQRLRREDWTQAALQVLGERGVGGLSVEPLAKSLGTTKGSFYWHFRDRDDLIAATLQRWEQEETDAVIDLLRPLDDPLARLRLLVQTIFLAQGDVPDRSVGLASDFGHPAVAEVLARVSYRRVAYVAEQLTALGVDPVEARNRALFAYTSYLGYSTLVRSAPGAVSQGSDVQGFLDSMVRLLTS